MLICLYLLQTNLKFFRILQCLLRLIPLDRHTCSTKQFPNFCVLLNDIYIQNEECCRKPIFFFEVVRYCNKNDSNCIHANRKILHQIHLVCILRCPCCQFPFRNNHLNNEISKFLFPFENKFLFYN